MSLALTVGKGLLVSYLKALLDPGMRRRLDEEKEAYVLGEIPRIIALVHERCADLEARGCTHYEANIIAHQVIEAQKDTLDEEKRARLTNVLINGFAANRWDKIQHRRMVRYAIDLEEEHIERLKHYASKEFRSYADAEAARQAELERLQIKDEDAAFRHRTLRDEIDLALDRELLSRALLGEQKRTTPKSNMFAVGQGVPMRLTSLGEAFLSYLKDPQQP